MTDAVSLMWLFPVAETPRGYGGIPGGCNQPIPPERPEVLGLDPGHVRGPWGAATARPANPWTGAQRARRHSGHLPCCRTRGDPSDLNRALAPRGADIGGVAHSVNPGDYSPHWL